MAQRATNGGSRSSAGRAQRPAADRQDGSNPGGGDLEIDEDLDRQRVEWRIQRAGWVAIAAVLLAALVGLFGSGPVSRTFAVDPNSPLWLEYERFGRQGGPTTLRLHLGPGSAAGGRARVWIDGAYLADVRIERITPRPEREESAPGRTYFTFATTASDRPTVVTFHLQPERFGALPGQVGLDDGAPLRFRQWIHP
jgi:hypothetical protein